MWFRGKGMKGAVSERGIIHLIPSGWIRGIPRQAGSGCRLCYTNVNFSQKALSSVEGFQNGQAQDRGTLVKFTLGEVAVGSKRGKQAITAGHSFPKSISEARSLSKPYTSSDKSSSRRPGSGWRGAVHTHSLHGFPNLPTRFGSRAFN